MSVQIRPATADRFDDLASLVGPRQPGAPACWCLSIRLPSAEFAALRDHGRPERLRELCAGPVAPGVLAYVDGEPAGWCAVAPRSQMGRLQRSRTIPRVDDLDVWSVVCFVVAVAHRRKGLAHHLLDGAVEHAAAHGAPAVEGYPVDTGGGRIDSTAGYVGTLGLFEAHGFSQVSATTSTSAGRPRWVVRRDLRQDPVASR